MEKRVKDRWKKKKWEDGKRNNGGVDKIKGAKREKREKD